MRAAIYARCSTSTVQNPETQLMPVRAYCAARGFTVVREFVDVGWSGAKDRRPALDELMAAARQRHVDVVVCFRLDRFGRSLRGLVLALEELEHLGVGFVSLGEGIDCTTSSGKLQMHILAALSQWERSRIQERVKAGLDRARSQGVKLGRPRRRISPDQLAAVADLPDREAARRLGIPRSTLQRVLARKPVQLSA